VIAERRADAAPSAVFCAITNPTVKPEIKRELARKVAFYDINIFKIIPRKPPQMNHFKILMFPDYLGDGFK